MRPSTGERRTIPGAGRDDIAIRTAGLDDIAIRTAGLDDIDVLTAMRTALRLEERPNVRGSSPARLRDFTREQLNTPGQVFFLAEAQGVAVGVLRCALQAAAESSHRSAMLTTAYVFPSHRRRGVMRQLVDTAAEWCSAYGVADLRLRNNRDNDAANAAWEALGFEIVQVVRQRVRRP